jgi:hypothetical protein
MATWLWGANVGTNLEGVIETNPGPATVSRNVELNVDLATTIVNDNGSTRVISREEVLLILNLFQQRIIRDNWPPIAGEE